MPDLSKLQSFLLKMAELGVEPAAKEIKKHVTDPNELAIAATALTVFATFATELSAALTAVDQPAA
jgi:hypothetical protein